MVDALLRSTVRMKIFLTTTVALIGLLIASSCSTQEELPIFAVRPGASEGTLATPALAQDAMLKIRQSMGGSKRVKKYVIFDPIGQPGWKTWLEIWVYDPEGANTQFMITFREDGQDSVNLEIRKM